MRLKRFTIWAMAAAMCGIVSDARATLITFDDLPATVTTEVPAATASGFAAVRTGALMSLQFIVDGVTVTVSREGGAQFDLVDNVSLVSQQGKSASFGSRSLDPFFDTSPSAFIFSFNTPIKIFSILAGDWGGYDTEIMALSGHNSSDGSGPAVETDQKNMLIGTSNVFSSKRFEISHNAGFSSVKFVSNGLRPGFQPTGMSVFLDRLYFDRGSTTPPPDEELNDPENTGSPTVLVPEPVSLLALMVGGVMLAGRRHRVA